MAETFLRTLCLYAIVIAGGCQALDPIPEGVCGNGVLDRGEDCDTMPDGSLGSGLACAAPPEKNTVATPESQACHYICNVGSGCPSGWDCGEDAICRRPSSELQPGARSPAWTPASFEVGDVNGDGHADLVGAFRAGRVEVWRGDPSGSFEEAATLLTDTPTGPLTVGRIDGDALGDLLLPVSLGFLVWRGQADGPPLPIPLGAIPVSAPEARFIPIRYPSVGPQGFLASVALEANGLNFASVFDYRVWSGYPGTIVGANKPLSGLGRRLPVADFDGDGNDEIVVGFHGASVARVYGVSHDIVYGRYEFDAFWTDDSDELVPIDLNRTHSCRLCRQTESGLKIDGGMHAADVDGDEQLDLVIGASGESRPLGAVVVALGRGKLGFDEPYVDHRFEAGEAPIAAGDLDGDDVADYVMSTGIVVARPEEDELELSTPPSSDGLWSWTDAELADVDGDGRTDVVAYAEGGEVVDVLRCGSGEPSCIGSGFFGLAERYPIPGSVKAVRTGALQGSPAADIVVVANDGSSDTLGVLLANYFEGPSEHELRARFAHVDWLEVAPAPVIGQTLVDNYEDVQVVQRTLDDRTFYAHLYSSASGQLTSPLVLPDNIGIVSDLAEGRRAVAGRFFGDEASDALALFGQRGDNVPRVWLVPAAEDAIITPPAQGQDLAELLGAGVDLSCAAFASGDVDADGRDEVVVLFGAATCGTPGKTWLAVGREVDQELDFSVREIALSPGGAKIALADLDGGGSADLIIAQPGRATLLLGDPSGLESEPMDATMPDGGDILDITPIARSSGAIGPGRAAVLTPDAVSLITFDGNLSVDARGFAAGELMRSADVNRDGLGDLIITGPEGVEVLFAVPELPLGDAEQR